MQNEYSGNGRYSGVMMWPGSEFQYQGKTPTYVQIYNNTMPWNSRVDKIMLWIKNSSQPANLVFAYFEEPDKTSHMKGINSPDLKVQISRVDATVKYLLDKIKEENLENKMNLIILSDHGMDSVTNNRTIHLDQLISNKTYESVISGPNGFILPNPGKFEEIYQNLTRISNNLRTFSVYKKDELPVRWHMKNTSRLNGKLYILAKPGYAFWNNLFEYIQNSTRSMTFESGTHGYDNEDPRMRAMFMASGPAFRKNTTGQPFDNVHVYPLIANVLGLKEPASGVRPDRTI
ncbi:ectonucleotide pyrophosphatase/phosphodiesterase family member 5-like, partial [Sipha flava]|uniref:Ectonucleotide pyrophosphatase/phosphodiesterase family member 5-like n=1 Tax=Sipha flava TaxID=143950 RepID=A0A8B8GD95_9HEMI